MSISSLTGECAAQKLKNFCSSSLWTCLHHMVILKSQNKINDFLMILAWASPFKDHKNIPRIPLTTLTYICSPFIAAFFGGKILVLKGIKMY